MRKIHTNIPVLFKPQSWLVTEEEYSYKKHHNNETIFTVGNGYLGVRGFFEEGFSGEMGVEGYSDSTTMINGIYEYHPYKHIWQRPGFPARYHSITPQVNALSAKVFIDDEEAILNEKTNNYSRILDMQNGTVKRQYNYKTSTGKVATLSFERFTDQINVHRLYQRISVVGENGLKVKVECSLIPLSEGAKTTKEEIAGEEGVLFKSNTSDANKEHISLSYSTIISKFDIAVSVSATSSNMNIESSIKNNHPTQIFTGILDNKTELSLTRCASYYTNKDCSNPLQSAKDCSLKGVSLGYDSALKTNKNYWDKFWEDSDIQITGDDLVQQGIRYSIFMLNQSVGKDGKTNISANGLTGTGYSGHTFWDTEIFMLPLFLYTQSEIAKQLLIYRYNIMPNALKRAIEMDDKGALFAWNSINGEECGHVFEAATAQYHINCDIFYAIMKYYEATNDFEFMRDYGIEILLNTSKCLSHRGNFIPLKDNKFCINCVCGPDEYNPVVDNNLYTNWLARKQFYFTLDMVEQLKQKDKKHLETLLKKCEIDKQELDRFKKAADNMYIPYHKELDIYMLDDNFFYKDPIDIENIPLNKLPLLTNLHPLNLWRYQVCKQADIVLLMYLCSDEFTKEMKKKVFDFYEPKTIHDSSLSAGVHSIVAMDVGYTDEAYGYLKQAARMDLDNVNRNTFFGVHAACMGSAYMMIVGGYGGMRLHDKSLYFNPQIPQSWQDYSFKIKFNNSKINVIIKQDKSEFTLISGDSIKFYCFDKEYQLNKIGEKIEVKK